MEPSLSRLPIGIALVIAGACIGWLLGAGINATMVMLVAGVAAVLITAGGDVAVPNAPPTGPTHADVEAEIHRLLDAIDDPVVVIAGQRIVRANNAARALLGGHVVGEDVRLAFRHPAAAERLLGDDGIGPVDLVGLGKRDQRWEMRVTAIADDCRVVQLVDRTGSHAAERTRVDFVANASHELRTPLASLLGFVETLQEEAGEDPAVRNRFLKVMFDEARRMQRLIDDLISLSRIEATKYREPADAVDFADLIAETNAALTATSNGRGADLTLEIMSLPPVRGDQPQLSQLLFNVIGNALKYGRAGTPVSVRAEVAGPMVRLTVADRGEGIAAEHLPRLTERFYRVDSGRSRALGGTGLGLAIVKHIVERHRGRLDIVSTVGTGTTVTILLPTAAPEAAVIKP